MSSKVKTKPQPEVLPLEDRLRAARAEADAYIDLTAQRIKNGPDAGLLPIGVIKQMLTKNSGCHCLVALQLMKDKRYG
jgi:hypothetical protein